MLIEHSKLTNDRVSDSITGGGCGAMRRESQTTPGWWPMSTGKTLALAFVAILLLSTLGAANVVVATERTALNGDYVSNTLSEEGFYDDVADETQESIQSEIAEVSPSDSEAIPSGFDIGQLDAEELAEESVPEEYIREQASANIDRVFDYLHGERSDLSLQVDTEGLKANVASAVTEQVEDVDPAVVLDESAVALPGTNYEIDGYLARQMIQSEASYERIQNDFHDRYSAQERDRIASDGKDRARDRTEDATSQYATGITEGTIAIQSAMIDGLATDMSYDEFEARYESGKQQLADGAGQAAVDQVDEQLGEEVSTSQWLDSELEDGLQSSRSYVQQMDTMQLVLPIVSLLLIALLYGISRTWQTTAKVSGTVFVIAGVLAFGITLVQRAMLDLVEDRAQSAVDGNEVVGMDLVTNFFQGIFDTLASQSLLLVVLGVVLIGLVYADRRGYLVDIKQQVAASGVTSGGEAARPPQEAQPPQGNHGQPGQPNRSPGQQSSAQPTGESLGQQPQGQHTSGQQSPDQQPQGQQSPGQQDGATAASDGSADSSQQPAGEDEGSEPNENAEDTDDQQ